jgi:ribonuclease-3
MTALEAALGYPFRDPSLLRAALVHSSFQAENREATDNERFEFLGDAVLGLAVTGFLFERFPDMREGEMAKVRAVLVSRSELAAVGRGIGLGDHLLLGRGEEATGGRDKDSILSDAVEALVAAVYLDAGFDQAREVVVRLWEDRIVARATRPGAADYKTRLQEVLAAAGLRPEYVVEGFGPDHARRFVARLMVEGEIRGEGSGRSKREAEQAAARAALNEPV